MMLKRMITLIIKGNKEEGSKELRRTKGGVSIRNGATLGVLYSFLGGWVKRAKGEEIQLPRVGMAPMMVVS